MLSIRTTEPTLDLGAAPRFPRVTDPGPRAGRIEINPAALDALSHPAPAPSPSPAPAPTVAAPPAPSSTLSPAPAETPLEEFEIVLGRRQVASVSFVVIVLLAVFSAVSYVAGKALAPRAAAVEQPAKSVESPAPPVQVTPPPTAAPLLEATIVPPPVPIQNVPVAKSGGQPDAPLFADPANGAVYIQIGAVERGIAVLLAEGLRSHGMESFVAPGPNDHIFRVLIGPLPNPASFTRAKETVDLLGLSTFARRYQK